jgi:hypothetical protein
MSFGHGFQLLVLGRDGNVIVVFLFGLDTVL